MQNETNSIINVNNLIASVAGVLLWHSLKMTPSDPDEVRNAFKAVYKGTCLEGTGPLPNPLMAGDSFNYGFKSKSLDYTAMLADGSTEDRVVFTVALPGQRGQFQSYGIGFARKTDKRKVVKLGQIGNATLTYDNNKDNTGVVTCDITLDNKSFWMAGDTDLDAFARDTLSKLSDAVKGITTDDIKAAVNLLKRGEQRFNRVYNKIGSRGVHNATKRLLDTEEMRSLTLRANGGVYFVPNVPTVTMADGSVEDNVDNPMSIFEKLGNELSKFGNRFYMHNVSSDDTDVVAESLAESLEDIAQRAFDELNNMVDITRRGQITTHVEGANDIARKANTYADLLGLKAQQVMDKVSDIKATANDMLSKFNAENPTRRKSKSTVDAAQVKARAAANARLDIARNMAALVGPDGAPIMTLEQIALASGLSLEIVQTLRQTDVPKVEDNTPKVDNTISNRDVLSAARKAYQSKGSTIELGGFTILHDGDKYIANIGDNTVTATGQSKFVKAVCDHI